MYHLDNTSGVPEMPEPKDEQSMSPRWFGESHEQGGISWPGADWFNVVQAELLNLLAAAGIQPDKKSYDQLSKAIPVLGDARLRNDLAKRSLEGGANLSALMQGGTVQQAINYVTLEMLGGGTEAYDNSEALQAFFDGAYDGVYGGLELGPGNYKLKKSVFAKCPVTITGQGCINNLGDSIQLSAFIDERGSGQTNPLITIGQDNDNKINSLGFSLTNFAVIGNKSNDNIGLCLSAVSWQGKVTSIRIQDFGKQGLYIAGHLNDTMFDDLKILNCGGLINGIPYYAMDSYSGVKANDAGMNQCIFYRLHIEYARYAMKFKGWFCNFNDSHFEIGHPSVITSVSDSESHWIDIMEVSYPVVFNGCNFVGPTYPELVAGLTTVQQPQDVISTMGAVVGSSAPVAGMVDSTIKTEIIFKACTFTSGTNFATLKYLSFPLHNISLDNCRFTKGQSTAYSRPIYVGARLRMTNCEVFVSSATADNTILKDYVNNFVGPAVKANYWAKITGNTFWHTGAASLGSVSYAIDGANIYDKNYRSFIEGNTIVGYSGQYAGNMPKTISAWPLVISKNGEVTPKSSLRVNGSQVWLESAEDGSQASLVLSSLSSGFSTLVFSNGSKTLTHQYSDSGYEHRFTTAVGMKYDNDGANIRMYPLVDGTGFIGKPAARFNTFFSTNSTINTSNKIKKTELRHPTSDEIAAFYEIAQLQSVWQWLERYEAEGNLARLHSGPTVQDAIGIMTKYGLDWSNYACFCYDSWEEQAEIVKTWEAKPAVYENIPAQKAVIVDGEEVIPASEEARVLISEAVEAGSEVVTPYRPAGEEWGFRKEELLFWISRSTISKLNELEEKLSRLSL